jgi:hypothetical protein
VVVLEEPTPLEVVVEEPESWDVLVVVVLDDVEVVDGLVVVVDDDGGGLPPRLLNDVPVPA